jgi:two-component system sensor histidine kinase VanS
MSKRASNASEPDVSRSGLLRWRPRLTFRSRLTLTFTVLLALAGILMVIIVNLFMRTVPTYFDANGQPAEVVALRPTLSPSAAPSGTASQTASTVSIALRSPSDILNTTLLVSVLVLVALVVAGALISWLVAGRMLRPLQAVNRAATLAGTGSFDHRVGLTGPQDELRDLSDTFDDMLDRLDRSFSATNRFAANASHELRTPLAATQTMLEVALADPDPDINELRAVAQRVLETNKRNIETVEALLDLTEIDYRDPATEPVSLSLLVRDALRESNTELETRHLTIQLDVDETAKVRGDEVLLHQAINNLVRNAIRHNDQGGDVRISTQVTAGRASLSIENTGPRVPSELVASLTEPFVRGAGRTARGSESVRGHGLGLAIVASVALAHRGHLRLTPRDGGGLTAELDLPA